MAEYLSQNPLVLLAGTQARGAPHYYASRICVSWLCIIKNKE